MTHRECSAGKTKKDSGLVDTLTHYECLIEEGQDPFHDEEILQDYMARWDGPEFFTALGTVQDKHVAEVGVGTGRLAKSVLDLGCAHFKGIDISPSTAKKARENLRDYQNVELIVANIESFVRKDSFDIIYSVLTFMHVKNKKRAISNMVASLKTSGYAVVSISKQEELMDYGKRRIRLFPEPAEDYVGWFRDLGCEVEPTIELVDSFALPSGEKNQTYGQVIATIVKATKP